ncbi:MAG: septum site-determining protein MinC [Lachnospiraceae bacterium]|nr:septum site-determining protein MinC [Lachnospiraceae bacterium]
MSQNVLIKSFQNGLNVIMEPDVPFPVLLESLENKFRESSKFFQDARLALSLEGRELTTEEEKQVVDTICNVSGLDIVCLVGKDENWDQLYLKAIQQTSYKSDRNNGQFYRGTLKNGQTLETETSIVILGDVYPGSSIVSLKDIIILGGLYGEAYAGGGGEAGHFVVALDMSPEKLKIGDLKYRTERLPKWSIKPKVQPKIAYMKDKKIVIESLTKELLVSSLL